MRLRPVVLALASLPALAACDSYYDDYGYGYGYGGVSVGYGSGYSNAWYDPYWSYYSSYPYWGWYNGFYYPGTGIYIYDQWQRPFRWNDGHRRFWMDRRSHWDRRGHWNGRTDWRDNWGDFRRDRRWDRDDRRRCDDGDCRRWRRGG